MLMGSDKIFSEDKFLICLTDQKGFSLKLRAAFQRSEASQQILEGAVMYKPVKNKCQKDATTAVSSGPLLKLRAIE